MDLRKLQDQVHEWSKRNFPRNTPDHTFKGMVEELGELSHALLKRDQGIRGTPEEHAAAIRDAVGDLIVYTLDFCARSGFYAADALEEAWLPVSKRDWIKFPKNGRTE